MDKRRNKKGKWEYLIRWKGYGSKEDTWEPEHHLLHCEEFIDQFNSLQLQTHKQPKNPKRGALIISHPPTTEKSRARSEARKKKSSCVVGDVLRIRSAGLGPTQKRRKEGLGPRKHTSGDRIGKPMTYKTPPIGGPRFVAPLRDPHNGLQNGEMEPQMYRTAAKTSSHRPPSDKLDGEVGDMDTTGQQFTRDLGKF